MSVRITTIDGHGRAIHGKGTRISVDDVDISGYVRRIEVTIDREEVVAAHLHVIPSFVDIDVPDGVTKVLIEPDGAKYEREEAQNCPWDGMGLHTAKGEGE